jgi:hypothetical protein
MTHAASLCYSPAKNQMRGQLKSDIEDRIEAAATEEVLAEFGPVCCHGCVASTLI